MPEISALEVDQSAERFLEFPRLGNQKNLDEIEFSPYTQRAFHHPLIQREVSHVESYNFDVQYFRAHFRGRL